MKRIVLLLITALLLLTAVTCAEETVDLKTELTGSWYVALVYTDGASVSPKDYGLNITLLLNEDGSASFDYNGEPEEGLSWYVRDGKAYIKGYNPDEDVELDYFDVDSLRITDSIGQMYLGRVEEEA